MMVVFTPPHKGRAGYVLAAALLGLLLKDLAGLFARAVVGVLAKASNCIKRARSGSISLSGIIFGPSEGA